MRRRGEKQQQQCTSFGILYTTCTVVKAYVFVRICAAHVYAIPCQLFINQVVHSVVRSVVQSQRREAAKSQGTTGKAE